MDSKAWKREFSVGPEFINPYTLACMKRRFKKGKSDTKDKAIELVKNTLATVIVLPIMIGGVVYSIIVKD